MGSTLSAVRHYVDSIMQDRNLTLFPDCQRVITRGFATTLFRVLAGNPADRLGPDVFQEVLRCLDAKDLVTCMCVSHEWRTLADDDRLWQRHCQDLWNGKMSIPTSLSQAPSRKSYVASLEDCKRVAITEDELCGFTWSFKFKHTWLGYDSLDPMVRYFHRDGSFTTGEGDPWADVVYKWRFRSRKEGQRGVFVQVHNFPSLEIMRTPDWNWRMENIFVEFEALAAGPRTCACCAT